ncbi:MAG: NAD+ dependent glucose-6-phosphate dehydrogenase [Candidatus Latescibacterota bacterium]|jgi:NAD+ dependent glucose-6-phosphate dehydrogenase
MTNIPLKVHITGAYGLIGNLVYRHLSQWPERYDLYGSGRRIMSSRRADESVRVQIPEDHFCIADIGDAQAIENALEGMDAVLHIAAVPGPEDTFEDVLESNIRGTYNVLEACRKHGIGRLVYASSIMTTWGYGQFVEPYKAIRDGRVEDIPDSFALVKHTDPVRPTEPYSMSKVWAEGACRTYNDAHDLSVICLRIGWVNKENAASGIFSNSIWCSHRDIVSSFECALVKTAEPVYDICFALSDNKYRWVDLEHAREVTGFVPQDRGED